MLNRFVTRLCRAITLVLIRGWVLPNPLGRDTRQRAYLLSGYIRIEAVALDSDAERSYPGCYPDLHTLTPIFGARVLLRQNLWTPGLGFAHLVLIIPPHLRIYDENAFTVRFVYEIV